MSPHVALPAWAVSSLPTGLHLPPLQSWADPRTVVAVIGVVLILAGGRLYRLVIISPGVLLGVLAGLSLTAGSSTQNQLIAAGALAVIGAAVLFFVERLAISVIGAAVTGGLVNALAPMLMQGPVPWYVPAAGAVLGLFLFPSVFRAALTLIAPALGAVAVCWALGRPNDLLLMGGLTVFGAVVHLLSGGRRSKGDD